MKKWTVLAAGLVFLGGCASLGLKTSCDGRSLVRPSFFAQGQTLAAFKIALFARGNELDGILQIKKTAEDAYDATLFAVAGGYKLMQATVTKRGTGFVFITPPADKAVVRAKADSFLTLLLFPPDVYKSCREKDGLRSVTYEKNGAVHYEYEAGGEYPRALTYRKTFGTARMNFGQYAPYEDGALPHYIYYQDGSVEAEFILLTLKK